MKYTIVKHAGFDEINVEIDDFKVSLLDLGATIKSIKYLKNNKEINALLEYKDVSSYENNDIFLGSTLGRFAGRVKYDESQFEQDIRNNEDNVLHGGIKTSAKEIWKYNIQENDSSVEVSFSHLHENDGFRGTLDTTVHYIISKNEILIKYVSQPLGESLCNITNHAYFSLGMDDINDIVVQINDGQIALVSGEQLPTGEYIEMPNEITVQKLDEMFPETKGIDNPIKFSGPITFKSTEAIVEIESSYPYVVLYGQSYESQNEFKDSSSKTKAGLAIELQKIPNDPVFYTEKQNEYILYKFR